MNSFSPADQHCVIRFWTGNGCSGQSTSYYWNGPVTHDICNTSVKNKDASEARWC